jgi:hypothetical protein
MFSESSRRAAHSSHVSFCGSHDKPLIVGVKSRNPQPRSRALRTTQRAGPAEHSAAWPLLICGSCSPNGAPNKWTHAWTCRRPLANIRHVFSTFFRFSTKQRGIGGTATYALLLQAEFLRDSELPYEVVDVDELRPYKQQLMQMSVHLGTKRVDSLEALAALEFYRVPFEQVLTISQGYT